MGYREEYLRRAKLAAKVLRFVPFIKMAALNGSLVRGEENAASDIDFLIIAERGRLYTARFFATLFVHLTGCRRYGSSAGRRIAGRICLNCYLSNDNPDISPKDPKSRQKVANAYKYLIPLVGCECQEKKFHLANQWMRKYRVGGQEYSAELRKGLTLGRPARTCRGLNPHIKYPLLSIPILDHFFEGRFGDLFEKLQMHWQRRRILAGRDGFDELVATAREIRLHPRKLAKLLGESIFI